MSAATELQALLAASAGVTALVESRISADRAEQGAARPFVTYSGTTEPQRALDGSVHGTLTTFEIQCWGDSRATAEAVADAVQAACDGAHQYITARAAGSDNELDLEAVVMTCLWWTD